MESVLRERFGSCDWLYEQSVTLNKSSRQIAVEQGCSRGTVRRYLRYHSIPISSPGVNRNKANAQFKNFSRQVPQLAVGLINNQVWLHHQYITLNRSMKDIAQSLGLSTDSVVNWLREFDIWKPRDLTIQSQAIGYRIAMGFDRGSAEACVKRIHGHNQKFIMTQKGGKIYCHSYWEQQVAEVLDNSDSVRAFEKDSLKLRYHFDNKTRIYIPDFLVTLTDGRVIIIEVKADYFLDDPKTKIKLEVMKDYARRHKCESLVLSGRLKVNLIPLMQLLCG